MEESAVQQRLAELEAKIDAVYKSVEQTRKYFLAMLIATGVAFVLPLIGLLFAIPSFLSTYSALGGL